MPELVYSPIYDQMVPADLLPPTGFASNVPGYLGYSGPTDLVNKLNPLQILGGGFMDDATYAQLARTQGFSERDIAVALARRAGLPDPIPAAQNPITPINPWITAGPTMATVGSPQPPIPILPPDSPHPLQPNFFSSRPPDLPTNPGSIYSPTRPLPAASADPTSAPITRGPLRTRKITRGAARRLLERIGVSTAWLTTATSTSLIALLNAYYAQGRIR